jgi:hypothetical protein
MNFEEQIKDFHDKIWNVGNHQEYGMFVETYEERLNELLLESNKILEIEMSLEKRVQIMCWQFWIVGNLSGQKLKIKEENKITSVLKTI